jgi:AraC family transcriptional regulator
VDGANIRKSSIQVIDFNGSESFKEEFGVTAEVFPDSPGSRRDTDGPIQTQDMAMQLQRIWVDRGETQDKVGHDDPSDSFRIGVVSRSASLGAADNQGSFWLMLRGNAQFDCREGRFRLHAGEWVALDRESRPTLLADRHALALVLLLPSSGSSALEQRDLPAIYPGRGRITARNMRLALHLWRRAGAFATIPAEHPADTEGTLRHLLHFLSSLQVDLTSFVDRCPGRSLRRKRQVFARMQRARLYLDGNLGRLIRLSELAQLCNFSVWYFTKTFHALYQEGPREMISRTRLQQASDLLKDTSLSVGEVGAACGFENACSFARAFRAHYGTTASGYRKSMRFRATPIRAQRTGTEPKAATQHWP